MLAAKLVMMGVQDQSEPVREMTGRAVTFD